MAATAQLALPFEQLEHSLYHDTNRSGFIALLSKDPGRRESQRPFRLSNMDAELAPHVGKVDRWISQGEFFKPNRRVVHLSRMPVAFADLDTYKNPRLATLSPDRLANHLLDICDDRQIPRPSIVVYSGRGLQVKWLFANPVPQAALPRWSAVQRQLNKELLDFGADPFAKDASRVLRLEGSVHSGSGQVVRVLHLERAAFPGSHVLPNGVAGYDFDDFADEVLPFSRQDLEQLRADRAAERAKEAIQKAARAARNANFEVPKSGSASSARALSGSVLSWDRLSDLRLLARIRGHERGLPPGLRNEFVFLGACFLSQACLVRELRPEIEALAAEFAPTWSSAELASSVSAVFRRAEAAARGETVEFNGQLRSPRYLFKNTTLVDRLEITDDEARQLKTILPESEARRRDAERKERERREHGVIPREEYLKNAASKRELVRSLAAEGMTQAEISRCTGIHPSTVSGYLKQ